MSDDDRFFRGGSQRGSRNRGSFCWRLYRFGNGRRGGSHLRHCSNSHLRDHRNGRGRFQGLNQTSSGRNRFRCRCGLSLTPPDDSSPDPFLFHYLSLCCVQVLADFLNRRIAQRTHMILDLNPQPENTFDEVFIAHVEFLCQFMDPGSCHEATPFVDRYRSQPDKFG